MLLLMILALLLLILLVLELHRRHPSVQKLHLLGEGRELRLQQLTHV